MLQAEQNQAEQNASASIERFACISSQRYKVGYYRRRSNRESILEPMPDKAVQKSSGASRAVSSALRRIARDIGDLDGRDGTKYRALCQAFRKEIEAGHLAPGTRLPSDSALAAALPASLVTVQKALRLLADEGLLVRRHRRGTFVFDSPVAESEVRHLKFISDDKTSLLPAYVRVLSIHVVANDREWSHHFPEEKELIRIDRICNINFEFDVILETYLPARRFAALRTASPRELDGTPLAHYLDKRLGAPTAHLERRFRLVPLSDTVCAALMLPTESLGLAWETYAYSRDRDLIMMQVAYVPPTPRWLAV